MVKDPSEVKQDDGPAGLFARIAALGAGSPEEEPEASSQHAGPFDQSTSQALASSGLFKDDFQFLDAAIRKVLEAPERDAPQGIGYKVNPKYRYAALTPPPELVARLEVLPQSYIKERKVKERLHLATSKEKGKQGLHQAHEGTSKIMWPEQSYLTPLHPVLDWAADHVLAATPRDAIYALPGEVDLPSVLVVGNLLNPRGQIIRQQFLVGQFVNLQMPFWNQYATAEEAIASLGLPETNKLQEIDTEALQPLVAAAVTKAEDYLETSMESAQERAHDRVASWKERTDAWEKEAEQTVKRASVREHIRDVDEERELLDSLAADRFVARPLLVVVPREDAP